VETPRTPLLMHPEPRTLYQVPSPQHMESRNLPLLVQPAVLFPGAILPIRLWHPRQRKLIKDVIAGDRMVGVVSVPDLPGGDEATPKPGHVGCLARVVSAKKIPNRQVRVVVEGKERFAIHSVVPSTEPYQQGMVTPYVDFEESGVLLTSFADEVRNYYTRYLSASGRIGDAVREKAAQLPADPVELSMVLPAMLHLDEETCQRFLASRSTLMRLRELSALLSPAATTAEASAEVHVRSRTNGHGAKRS
jgi:Lon protease-like protein